MVESKGQFIVIFNLCLIVILLYLSNNFQPEINKRDFVLKLIFQSPCTVPVPAVGNRRVHPEEEPDEEEGGDDHTGQEPGDPGREQA